MRFLAFAFSDSNIAASAGNNKARGDFYARAMTFPCRNDGSSLYVKAQRARNRPRNESARFGKYKKGIATKGKGTLRVSYEEHERE